MSRTRTVPSNSPSADPRGTPQNGDRLDGRVATATASGRNIGAATARRLAEIGATVLGIMADVSEPAEAERVVAETEARAGPGPRPVDFAASDVSRSLDQGFSKFLIDTTALFFCSGGRPKARLAV